MTKRSRASWRHLAAIGAAVAGSIAAPSAHACGLEPMLGSMCIFAGNFAPRGFALTNGQLLSIAQNSALFSILGTTYGGDGRTTFALPDTRGRVVIGSGQGPGRRNYDLGQTGGVEAVTLGESQMPIHTHGATTQLTVTAKARGNSATGNADGPGANSWAARPRGGQYSTNAPDVDMKAGSIDVGVTGATTVQAAGGSQPFDIIQPFVTLNYIIATEGIFPSRN